MKFRVPLIVLSAIVSFSFTAPAGAQNCDTAPLFDLGGPVCSSDRQDLPCACSECLVWNASPSATWYEIQRCDHGGGNCTIVGDTRWRNRPAFRLSSSVTIPAVFPTVWCAAWDRSFPLAGRVYDYSVRACATGSAGAVCATQLSNAVAYAAAPYMCIDRGLEVPCAASGPPPGAAMNDLNGNGIPDAMDPDIDGDGVPNDRDNCPYTYNVGQRDADGDGVGDACDPDPLVPGSARPDTDGDGVDDLKDNCPGVYNPTQSDRDGDGTGDACDNCVSEYNQMQSDFDHDGQGDRCDVDDGEVYAVWGTRTQLIWLPETGYQTWCVYRGDLAVLRATSVYTQALGSNSIAARSCGMTTPAFDDSLVPAAGKTAFYLVAPRPSAPGLELGKDSDGKDRPNDNPCP